MVTRSLLVVIFFSLFLGMVVFAQSDRDDSLTEELIKGLFTGRVNDDGNEYKLDIGEWREGSFTSSDAREALVSFHDGAQCHAVGWGEIWLLKFKNGWKIDRKLVDADGGSFRIVDIEGDGKFEVWVHFGFANQGWYRNRGRLLSLNKDTLDILYATQSEADDHGMSRGSQRVDFWDIDNDGTLELLDRQRTEEGYLDEDSEWYDNWVVTSSAEKVHIYKFKDGKLVETQFQAVK